MKIGIIYKHKASEPLEVLEGFIPWLNEKGLEPLVEESQAKGLKGVRADTPEVMAGEAEFIITGQLADGTVFEGTDVIRVINKGRKK